MIAIRDIGIALNPPYSPAGLDVLERALDEAQRFGYRLVEIEPLRTIIGGQLRAAEVERLQGVLQNFDLRYSVHGLERLNLAYDPRDNVGGATRREPDIHADRARRIVLGPPHARDCRHCHGHRRAAEELSSS